MNLRDLPFVEFGNWSKLPGASAVYFCLDSQDKVLYIGQTRNLKRRWSMSHGYRAICGDRGAIKLSWLLTDESRLFQVESQMIARFNPPMNINRNKALPCIHGSKKKQYQFVLTQEVSNIIDDFSDRLNISRSELLERAIRSGGLTVI
jgi:excinuclease UvrABC nuclease subunit